MLIILQMINMEKYTQEMLGSLQGIGIAVILKALPCQLGKLYLKTNPIPTFMEHCLWPPSYLPLHCLFKQQEITPVFGGGLGTYQICPMEKGQQTVKIQVIRYKTNIHVYHAYLNHCTGLLDREDLIYVSLDKMLLCRSGSIILLVTQREIINGLFNIRGIMMEFNVHIMTANVLSRMQKTRTQILST